MAEDKIRVLFLWHMHQPYYKDLVTDSYRLPWARLHALKDYYGMVAMLEEFPRIHQTFNLVPSLLLQLEDYANGTAREPVQEIAFKRERDLTRDDRLFILRYFFQANLDHLISRYPRYRQLYDRMQANQFVAEQALSFFQANDFTDLQVLSQLAWFDEIFLEHEPELRALVAKGQDYDYADQRLLQAKQQQAIRKVLAAYRAAADRGQIEISTSPLYHPILPLLCDTNIATVAHPWVRLPRRRFQHPEDARLQLERGIALHKRFFGAAPKGVWPSEGSVSEEVLGICASLGIRWIASDQQVLSNSIGVPFYRDGGGTLVNADKLYAAYTFSSSSGTVQMLFRDHELSDRIGFVYSGMDAGAAASDFIGRIKQSAWPVLCQGKSPLVPIILDGENAWEYYPGNGRPFLRALYRLLSDDPRIECSTISEALEGYGRREPLPRLAPGSWINANFDIWIGAEEDNQAWDLLSDARDFYEECRRTTPPEKRDLALEELLVAEGSDWCWWYGPEHSTANDADFDALYRSHLSNVYHALGHRPPDALSQPIGRFRQEVESNPPVGAISPRIDGVVTSYFEWMGAGFYSPVRRAGTMHGGPAAILHELYFGRDSEDFFLRIDFHDAVRVDFERVRLRIVIRGAQPKAVVVIFAGNRSDQGIKCAIHQEGCEAGGSASLGQAALGRIFELRLSFAAMEIAPDKPVEFQVTVWEENFPRETFPLEGWLSIPPPG